MNGQARRFASQAKGKSKAFGRAVFAIPVVGTFGLGTWQAQRWKWKKDLIEERVRGLQDPPVAPPPSKSSGEQWAAMHFRRMQVKGRFLERETFFVGPRAAPSTQPAAGGGLISSPNPTTGFFCITPFLPSNAESDPILVNRGWIPAKMRSTIEESAAEFGKEQSIVCVPRPGERKSMFITNDAARGNWLSMEVESMSEHTQLPNVAPVICELLEASEEQGGKYPLKKRPENLITFHVMPFTHVVYATTWYSLSLAMAIGTIIRFR